MSTQYNGLAGNIGRPAAVSIASSTNTIPISVTTSANHLLTEGDTVYISGHNTNSNANGVQRVHILSATSFQLTGSSGNGVGGATGTVQNLQTIPQTSAVPSDGDDPTAASVNVSIESLFDKVAWIEQRMPPGAYTLVTDVKAIRALAPPTGLTSYYGPLPQGTNAWTAIQSFDATGASNPTILPGDIIDAEFTGSAITSAQPLAIGMTWAVVNQGQSFAAATYNGVAGASTSLPAGFGGAQGSAIRTYFRVNTTAQFLQAQILDVAFSTYGNAGSPATLTLLGEYTIWLRLWRPQ
jgi:hypothetical protein